MEVYQGGRGTVKRGMPDGIELPTEMLWEVLQSGLDEAMRVLGMRVAAEMLQREAEALVGKKGKHDKGRSAYRHGSEPTKIVMGGAKVAIEKPRVRCKDGGEIALQTLGFLQNEDPLNAQILSRLLLGISCRNYQRTTQTGAEKAEAVSKSAVSRRFKAAMKEQAQAFFSRRLDEIYPVILVDGIEIGKMTVIAAMGIRRDGVKRILGIMEGGTENSTVVKSLFADLVERGLSPEEPRLYIIDGGKALARAIRDTFPKALTQRCQVHKKRNVLDHLPESEKAEVSRQMSMAYLEHEHANALKQLEFLATRLEYRYPSAAASLREGMAETLTVHRLGIGGLLRKTLSSTNALESANSVCRQVISRAKNIQNGDMARRLAAAGFMEAERHFHRVNGYRDIPVLIAALRRLTSPDDGTIIQVA